MLSLLGVAIETALAATVLLGGLTFWIPMVPGVWLARIELRRNELGLQLLLRAASRRPTLRLDHLID